MRRFARCLVGGAILVLGFAGGAHAQETPAGAAPRVWRQPEPPAARRQEGEPAGGFTRIRAGLARMLTGGFLQLHVNGAYQGASSRHEMETVLQTYGEQSRLHTREAFSGGGHVDVGGSLRVWRRLLLGVSYTHFKNPGAATVTGTVPHPLLTGRDRMVPEQTVSLPRRERATHAYLGWRLPLRDLLHVDFSAGATYFSLTRGVVATLAPMETGGPPFAEVALQADTGEHTRNGGGFNAGVDVTYMLTSADYIPQVGAGLFMRVTGGSVSIPRGESWSRESVGGVQAGIGLRLRF